MSTYRGEVLTVNRRLDGKGRLSLPADFREAVGLEPDAEVEVSVIRLIERNKAAIVITGKEGNK